jgi:hypothetical protein
MMRGHCPCPHPSLPCPVLPCPAYTTNPLAAMQSDNYAELGPQCLCECGWGNVQSVVRLKGPAALLSWPDPAACHAA